MRGVLLGLLLATAPAHAQEQLDGTGFEALVEGRTLGWFRLGGTQLQGIEIYYPGRRVIWYQKSTGECLEGTWEQAGAPDDPAICFRYRDQPTPVCWETWRHGTSRIGAISLESGGMLAADLGQEHDLAFGCSYLGS